MSLFYVVNVRVGYALLLRCVAHSCVTRQLLRSSDVLIDNDS